MIHRIDLDIIHELSQSKNKIHSPQENIEHLNTKGILEKEIISNDVSNMEQLLYQNTKTPNKRKSCQLGENSFRDRRAMFEKTKSKK